MGRLQYWEHDRPRGGGGGVSRVHHFGARFVICICVRHATRLDKHDECAHCDAPMIHIYTHMGLCKYIYTRMRKSNMRVISVNL